MADAQITGQQHKLELAAKLQKLISPQEIQQVLIEMANEEAKRKTDPSYKYDFDKQKANEAKVNAVLEANFQGKDLEIARESVNNGVTISVSAKVAVELLKDDKELIKEVTAAGVEELKNPLDAEIKKKAEAARGKLYDKAVTLLPESIKQYPQVFDVVKISANGLAHDLAADAVAGTVQTITVGPELSAKLAKFMNRDDVNDLVQKITQPYVRNALSGTAIDAPAVEKARQELSAKLQQEFKPEEASVAVNSMNTTIQMTMYGSLALSTILEKHHDLIVDAVRTDIESKIQPDEASKKKASDARNLLIEKGREVLPANLKNDPQIIESLGREMDSIIKENVDQNMQRLQIPQQPKGAAVDPLKMKPEASKGAHIPLLA